MFTSELLTGLKHCFTERDDYFCPERVDFYAQMMGVEKFVRPKQVHGDHIEIDPSLNEGFDADAVILTQKGRGLVMNFADCTPIILFDPVLNIAAGVHAGWRGTAAQIAQKTARKMIELGSAPENIRAAIGPCISKCCFEVTGEVVEALQPYTVYEPKGIKSSSPALLATLTRVDTGLRCLIRHSKDSLASLSRTEKFMVDLKATNRRQLEEIGVTQIDVMPYCTVCENDRFFSYRLTKTDKRHNIILAL
ncbi:MAG: peptidoglycan editing factor PgeF [Fusobacterium sp.]|nr:peptidoglycan editing factor PgeF [Fusobacterium sp.]